MKSSLLKKFTAAFCAGTLLTFPFYGMTAYAEDTATETEIKSAHEMAEELTASMPLRQKIAQMIMLNIRYWSEDGSTENRSGQTTLISPVEELLEKYDFAGTLLFADNVVGTEQTTRFTDALQTAASKGDYDIPLLISADQEGGSVSRLKTGTNTCGNMALGATNDTQLAYENASIIGSELSAVGINLDFAPVMDINNNPKNPIINIRSFSSEPELVCQMGTSFIKGLSEHHIISTAKHFPGHGDTDTDSHTGLPLIDKSYEQLKEHELIPFQAAMDAGIDAVMTAHIQFPQIETETYTSISTGEEIYLPATLSKTILTDIMRKDMGFQGIIVTDGMQMDALKKNYDIYETAVLAINAGVDILLEPVTVWSPDDITFLETYLDKLEEAVTDGKIPESRINESCTRILELKYQKQLFQKPEEDIEQRVKNALSLVGSEEHHAKELEIAGKAVTLIQNQDNVLPLALEENERIAFFYPSANAKNSFVYAFDKLKKDGTIPETAEADFICCKDTTPEECSELISNAKAVVISSENWGESEFNPASDDGTQAKFIDELTALAHSLEKPVIVLSMTYPYDVARYTAADAVLAAYGSKKMTVIPEEYNGELATYGPNYPAAIMTVFGAFSPSGKLPVTIYQLSEDYKFTDEVLYPFGYGLTYLTEEPETETEPETEPQPETTASPKPPTTSSNQKQTTTARAKSSASSTTANSSASKTASPATGEPSAAGITVAALAAAVSLLFTCKKSKK